MEFRGTQRAQSSHAAPASFRSQMPRQSHSFQAFHRPLDQEIEALQGNLSSETLEALISSVSWSEENQLIFSTAIELGQFGEDKEVLKCLAQNIGKIEWTCPLAKSGLLQVLCDSNELVRTDAMGFEGFNGFRTQNVASTKPPVSAVGRFGNDPEVLIELAKSLAKIKITNNLEKTFLIQGVFNMVYCCKETIAALIPVLGNTNWNSNHTDDLIERDDFQTDLFLILFAKFYDDHKEFVTELLDKMIWEPVNQEYIISKIRYDDVFKSKEKLDFFIQKVLPKFDLDSQRIQDLLLNHIDNMESIFIVILGSKEFESMGDRISTLNMLCGLLKTKDIKIPADPFIDAFFDNSEIFSDLLFEDERVNEISSLLKNSIVNKYLEQDKNGFVIQNRNFLQYLGMIVFADVKMCEEYHNIFNQIKFHMSKEILMESGTGLGRNYLRFAESVSSTQFIENLIENVLYCEDVNDFVHNYYIFFAPDQTTLIVLHQEYFSDILEKKEPRMGFNSIYFFKKSEDGEFQNESLDHTSMKSVVSEYPILRTVYQAVQAEKYPAEFVKALELGEYEALFVKAIGEKEMLREEKLGSRHDSNLARIFAKFLTEPDKILGVIDLAAGDISVLDLKVTDEFVERICAAYEYQGRDAAEKSELLLLVATIFARLSSSHYFGTERASPVPLRNMSLALLNKAVELNVGIISAERFEQWKNILTGNRNAFSCTAILSNKMLDVLKQKTEIYDLFPVEWK